MHELSKQLKKFIKQLLTMLNKPQETEQIQRETASQKILTVTVLQINPVAPQVTAHLVYLIFHNLSNTLHDKYTLN
jgi:hypothetical protein